MFLSFWWKHFSLWSLQKLFIVFRYTEQGCILNLKLIPPPLDLYFGPNESFCNEELRAAGEKLSTFFVGRGGENSQIKTFNLNLQKKKSYYMNFKLTI